MRAFYTKLPKADNQEDPDYYEKFAECKKSVIRYRVNTLLSDRLFIISEFYLQMMIAELCKSCEDLISFSDDDPQTEFFLKILSYQDLEEMFREEIEYHVIRKNMPVYIMECVLENEKIFKIFLRTKMLSKASLFTNTTSFNSFRDAERFIFKYYKSVSRIIIPQSQFRSDNNLIAVFKINETDVKQDLIKK